MTGNLLSENLIETNRGPFSLPALMAAMSRGEVASFPALRPHQRPAWHMFLVQLAVLALANGRCRQFPVDEDAWRDTLRSLTSAFPDDAPWCLVVDDHGSPAFLQPPDPGGLKWSPVATPDALDMIITSKNHDLKREIARQAEPQDWIFALVSLQTMEGFGGSGNYGISRMNGGSSSRAMIGLAPAHSETGLMDPAAWWRRDVIRLLERRSGLEGESLLWTLPWPEGQMLDLRDLDQSFIEICRRVRLQNRPEGICAIRSTSKGERINAKQLRGVTGDPWAPVHRTEPKTLTLGERDWDYRLLDEILYSGEWNVPELARPAPEEKATDMILVAEAFARGNSKTDGFRSRLVPVPKTVGTTMFGSEAIDLAKEQVDLVGKMDVALRDGLVLIAANGDWERRGKKKYGYTRAARASLSAVADALFFPTLWERLAAGTKEGRNAALARFARKLSQAAREEFVCAASGIPCARIMRPKAETRGSDALKRGIAVIFREMGIKESEHA